MEIRIKMTKTIDRNSRIVVLCHGGVIRSAYLNDYLRQKGYENVEYGGIAEDAWNRVSLEKLAEADVVISVHPTITDVLTERGLMPKAKNLIELDVEDRAETLGRTGDIVHRELEEQIEIYLQR